MIFLLENEDGRRASGLAAGAFPDVDQVVVAAAGQELGVRRPFQATHLLILEQSRLCKGFIFLNS